jgi:2-C-methyl-D-erythritol 4-phosphate cytidylyltransferase
VKKKVCAVVPSAGIGKRFGVEKNKPFHNLGGKPILVWCLEVLQSMSEIAEIIPVVKEDDLLATGELIEKYGIRKVRRIVPGGPERQDSVYNGLRAIDDDKALVLIHDGGRPFADREIFLNALKLIGTCDGVISAVRVKDTIKEVSAAPKGPKEAPVVRQTLNRDLLYAVQTPQVFSYRTIRDAHEKARKERYYGTDDAALVERCGGRIVVSKGSYRNIKITTPEDIYIAEALLKLKKEN